MVLHTRKRIASITRCASEVMLVRSFSPFLVKVEKHKAALLRREIRLHPIRSRGEGGVIVIAKSWAAAIIKQSLMAIAL